MSIVLSAMLLSIARRVDHSLTWDEPTTANRIRLELPALMQDCRANNALPLYYLLLKPWAGLFGESEAALRAFSVICFGCSVLVIGLAGVKLVGDHAGLLAALLLAASDLAAFQGANARPYALLLLLSAAVCAIALVVLDSAASGVDANPKPPTARWVVALALLNLAGLLAHPLFIVPVGATVVAAVFLARGRVRWAFVAAAACGTGLSQILWPTGMSGTAPAAIDWIPSPSWKGVVEAAGFIWGRQRGLLLAGWLCALAVVTAGHAALGRTARRAANTGHAVRVAAFIAVLACGAPLAISFWKPVFHANRSLIFGLPALCMALGFLLARSPWLPVSWALTGAMVVASGVRYVKAGAADAIPTRQGVAHVATYATCGDVLVFGHISGQEVSYYLRRLGASQCFEQLPFPSETSSHPGWFNDRAVKQRAAEVAREAESTVDRLDARVGSIWVFEGGSDEARIATALFRESLANRRQGTEVPGLRGSHFDTVVVYPPSRP